MVKKEVDPKLEPILDKIEGFDPERANRLREDNADPRYAKRAILEVTADGPRVTVVEPVPVKPKQQRDDYKICFHCGKKGAYLYDSLEFCKYCRPKKGRKNIPAGLLKPVAEPKKKSWLARLLRL